jgi:hypothetical protein
VFPPRPKKVSFRRSDHNALCKATVTCRQWKCKNLSLQNDCGVQIFASCEALIPRPSPPRPDPGSRASRGSAPFPWMAMEPASGPVATHVDGASIARRTRRRCAVHLCQASIATPARSSTGWIKDLEDPTKGRALGAGGPGQVASSGESRGRRSGHMGGKRFQSGARRQPSRSRRPGPAGRCGPRSSSGRSRSAVRPGRPLRAGSRRSASTPG